MSLVFCARGKQAACAALAAFALLVDGGCGSSSTKPSANTQSSTASSSTTSSNAGSSPASTTASPTAETLVEIAVAGGQVAGGVKRVQVDVGRSITIRVTSDVGEELHVHGYDLKRDLTPGSPVDLTFTADIPGVFDVEFERSGLEVAELQVG